MLFLLFKASAFIYHHPGTYLDSQWTENKAWICWKNHLAHVVLSKYNSPIKAQSVFCKSYPKQILDEEYTEAFRFLTVPFQRHAILNVASCDVVWTEQTFCLQFLLHLCHSTEIIVYTALKKTTQNQTKKHLQLKCWGFLKAAGEKQLQCYVLEVIFLFIATSGHK